MRAIWLIGTGAIVCVAAVAGQQQTQPPQQPTGAYAARCGSCHGAGMTGVAGVTAPAILNYIRYHTDADVSQQIRQKHPTLHIPDDELRQVIADARLLAGTNPAMATGGFTGRRAGRGGAGTTGP